MLFARHVVRVLVGLVSHAIRTGRIGLLALVVLGALVVIATVVVQVVGPVALYPFV